MNQHKSETIADHHHQSEPDIQIDPKLAVEPTKNFVNQDKSIITMESTMDQMSKEINMLQKERAEMKAENEKLRQRMDDIQQSKQGEEPQAVLISDSHLANSESSKTPPPSSSSRKCSNNKVTIAVSMCILVVVGSITGVMVAIRSNEDSSTSSSFEPAPTNSPTLVSTVPDDTPSSSSSNVSPTTILENSFVLSNVQDQGRFFMVPVTMFPLYIDDNDNEPPVRTTVRMWNSRTNVVKGVMLELLSESTKNDDGPTSRNSQPQMIRGYYNPKEYSKPNDFRSGDQLVAVDYQVFLPGGSCATTRQEYGIVSVNDDLGWGVDPGNIRIGRLGVVGSWYADLEYTFELVSPIQSLWTDAVDIEIEFRTTEDGNYQPLVATNPDDQGIREFPNGPVSGIVHVNFKAASFTNLNGLVTHRDGGGLHVAFCANNDSGSTPDVVVPPLPTMAPTIATPSPTAFSDFDGPYATEPVQEISSNKVTVEGIEELGRFFTVSVDLFPIQINTNDNERFRTTVRVANTRSGITKGVMMELVPHTGNLRGYYNPEEYTSPGDFAVGDELVLIDYEPLLSADGECTRHEYGIAGVDQELGWNVPPSNIRIGKFGVIGPWYDAFEYTFYLDSPVTSMWSDAVFVNVFYTAGNGFLPLNARHNSPTIRDFEAPVSGAVKVRFENAKVGTLNGLVTQRDAGGLHVAFCTNGSTGNSTSDGPPPTPPRTPPLPTEAPVDSGTYPIEVEVAITGDNVIVERVEEEGKYFWVSAANFPVAINLFENPKQKLVIRGNNTSAITRDKNRGLKGMVFYYYPDTNSYRGNYNPFEYAKAGDFAVGDLIAMDDYSAFAEGSCDRKDYRIVGMENLDLPDQSVGWNIPLSSIRIGKEGVVGGNWKDMEYTVYLDDPVSAMWTDAVDATIDIQVSTDGGISYNSIPATGSDPTLRPLGLAISGYLKIKFLGANFSTLNNLVTAREAGGLHIAFC